MAASCRYAACNVLREHEISYTLWYEDALRYHGSKSAVFSLCLLVESLNDAAACLRAAGWASAETYPHAPTYCGRSPEYPITPSREFEDDAVRVILLSVDSWPGVTLDDPYPTLPQLYNALAQRFLDTDDDDFRSYLALQLGYLNTDCPQLGSPDFLDALPFDIRQFCVDWRSETLQMTAPDTVKHERRIRDRARRGDWTLLPEGSAALGGTKPDRWMEAKLLAMMNERAGEHVAGLS